MFRTIEVIKSFTLVQVRISNSGLKELVLSSTAGPMRMAIRPNFLQTRASPTSGSPSLGTVYYGGHISSIFFKARPAPTMSREATRLDAAGGSLESSSSSDSS
ncbi:unnamed protein product [Linum trigynum]|uniref:Uncharacterized protein n=1 Tax=Linum trigynum TaxID=586398 RepID=A0AAV2FXG1_9ROSI